MSNITPSYVRVNPSYMMPEMLVQYSQASGAYALIGDSKPMVRLGDGDMYAYLKAIDVRTKNAGAQAAYNQLPSNVISTRMLQTPTYLLRTRAEYDHHDMSAAGNWGFSLVEAQRLGMRQGIFQTMRLGLLYGFNPTLGEGLVNSNGATAVNLPADSNGNTTLLTYDNGELAMFFLAQVSAIKTRCMQLGLPARVVICGPQRILGPMEYQNIVQLTQFQRPGAGSASTAGMIKDVLDKNADTLEWTYDDTLIGKGSGGSDLVVITVPEVVTPTSEGVNTNEFARLTPSLSATNLQLADMAAPREIPTPLPGGAIDVLSELRVTSGWGVRPEATTLASIVYS